MRLIALAGIVTGLTLGAAGSAGAVVLYSQVPGGSFSSDSPVSHDFSDDGFDSVAADDFTIGDGQVWTIDGVEVLGGADPGGSHTAGVGLYADGGAVPGSSLFSKSNISIPNCPALPAECNFTAALSDAPPLGPGRYWVTVQTAGAATWFWSVHPPTQFFESPAVWQNPGGDIVPPHTCTTYKPLLECDIGDANAGKDLVFALNGDLIDSRFSITQLSAKRLRVFANVNVPTAGTMAISGKGVKKSTKDLAAGAQRVRVKLKRGVIDRLRSGRKARVRVGLTFTATGGDAYTVATKAKLVPIRRAAALRIAR
jgi:hypothetical protein